MNYSEQRFKQIYEKFLFSLKIHHANPTHCEACYRDCLNEMDSLFLLHDTHDQFAKQLLNCKKVFQFTKQNLLFCSLFVLLCRFFL